MATDSHVPAPTLRFVPNHKPSAISHTLDKKTCHSEFPVAADGGAGGSGGHRRRGDLPRLGQAQK
jgi:hypothetical protein